MPEPAVGGAANSPINHLDDNNIREGLGSLNRWSQSTTSSKCSPHYANHSRHESATRVYTTDRYDPPELCVSPGAGAPSNLLSQAANAPNSGEQTQRRLVSQSSTGQGHDEIPKVEVVGIGASPTISPGVMGAVPSQPELLHTESMSSDPSQDPQLKSFSSEVEQFKQHVGQTSHILVEPRAQNVQGKADSNDPNTHSPTGKEGPSEKRRQGHSQKVMLSKALQKANTAVLLDNAANFEGAMEAYNDACHLLQLVMLRSNGGEDEKLKLQEIRDTYMIRVTELQRMDFSFRDSDSKALPERPLSQESYGEIFHPISEEGDRKFTSEDPSLLQRISRDYQPTPGSGAASKEPVPPRRQSLLPSAIDDDFKNPAAPSFHGHRSLSELSWKASDRERENLGVNIVPDEPIIEDGNRPNPSRFSELSLLSNPARDIYESTSWLDTIDESGASSPSSPHSKASSIYLRHRRNSRFSHCTEAEFDAALDAAVEAAYDEGLEPAIEAGQNNENNDIVANARRNVELAKQKVREAEREAEVAMTRGREMRRFHEQGLLVCSNDPESDYLDEEAEEEERLLEEMTRGYVMDDFEFDLQSKSALPRQSDSSSLSGRTWESSAASNTTAAGATLAVLAEDDPTPADQSAFPSISPPVPTPPGPQSSSGPSVRARRMSGQKTTELKIETNTRFKTSSDSHPQVQLSGQLMNQPPPPLPKDELPTSISIHSTKAFVPTSTLHQSKRNSSIGSLSEDPSTKPDVTRVISILEDDEITGALKISSSSRPIGKAPPGLDNLGRANPSLAPFRARNVSVPGPDLPTDSPETPSSNAFPTIDLQKGQVNAPVNVLPTPTGAGFAPAVLPSGGLYLFDSHIHSPTSPGSPNLMATNSPSPLEPCPESFLLRPFWLMRCIYQTIAHPRGGYLSTKLFIPRDVWRVKNVKIKGVEEKVSNCDLLTAALLKLSKVDMYDADAVLEEMQTFESVLDQVQMSLSKKIGNEVGVQGSMPLFRASNSLEDASTIDALPSRSSNGPSKSYLTSWRKLRSKNSGFGTATSLSSSKEASRDNLTISSLPMTSASNSLPPRRNIAQAQFNGPNANYMSALARLCDAAQVLDQIAQQVEDPGLRHSSQTLVGLELSTRHAAEFFGFYVCRFALNDIGIMLDKFIKRGSEWVLI